MILSSVLLLSLAAPQDASTSFLAGTPFTLMIERGSDHPHEKELLHKTPGVHTTLPDRLAADPLFQDFTHAKMLGGQTAVIASGSFGADFVTVDSLGQHLAPTAGWEAMLFSVTRDTEYNLETAFNREMTVGRQGQADVFVYFSDASIALPAHMRGEAMRLVDNEETRFHDPLDGQYNVTGIDSALMAMTLGILPTNRGGSPYRFYFTLENPQAASATVKSWYGGVNNISGASILVVQRDTTRANGWRNPTLFKSWNALHPVVSKTDQIDALSYDAAHTTMVYSRNRHANEQDFVPINVAVFDVLNNAVVYNGPFRTMTGEPVGKKMGMKGKDDIDAVCIVDPAMIDQTVGNFSTAGQLPQLSLSAYLMPRVGLQDHIQCRLVGMIDDGSPELAIFYMSLGGTLHQLGTRTRTLGDPNGSPVFDDIYFAVPASPTTIGIPVTFHAAAMSQLQFSISNSVLLNYVQ